VFTHVVFWPWFAGVVFLAAGLVLLRKELVSARGLDQLIALGPVFVASALATFGAEHLVMPLVMKEIVPAWMPAPLFWTYFVGFALFAAATSLVAMRFVRLSGTLLGVLFFLIVLTIHLPNLIAAPADRLAWTLVLRESAFAGGAWALAGSQSPDARTGKRNWMILIGRFCVAIAVSFFGVEQLLHPEFAPGVPAPRLTPAWVPLHAFWGYPAGALLLLAGAALLLNKKPRTAAVSIGVVMTLITLLLHSPILALARNPSQMTESINYVFDTLLFAGMALLVARALPAD
jgi:uncharacterized membrane protein YphA (DoxX/SURF4 family)